MHGVGLRELCTVFVQNTRLVLRRGGPICRWASAAEDPNFQGPPQRRTQILEAILPNSDQLGDMERKGMVNTFVHRGREGRNGMRKEGGRDLWKERDCLEGEGILLGKNDRPSTERFREPAIGRGCRNKPGGKGSADGGKEWKCKEWGRDRRWEIRG